jgi:hypothetical protein
MTASPTGTVPTLPRFGRIMDHVRLTGLRGPELLLDPDLPLQEPDPPEGEPPGLAGAETGPGAHEGEAPPLRREGLDDGSHLFGGQRNDGRLHDGWQLDVHAGRSGR